MKNIVPCRTCKAPMVYLRTAKGANAPCDAATVAEGDTLFDPQRHTNHFITCPDRDKFRRKTKPTEGTT